jgi:hypothetical protein
MDRRADGAMLLNARLDSRGLMSECASMPGLIFFIGEKYEEMISQIVN